MSNKVGKIRESYREKFLTVMDMTRIYLLCISDLRRFWREKVLNNWLLISLSINGRQVIEKVLFLQM
jgi:hypothetical protein